MFQQKSKPLDFIQGFKKRGKSNPDGWRIGYYPDEFAQIIKELSTTFYANPEKRNLIDIKIEVLL